MSQKTQRSFDREVPPRALDLLAHEVGHDRQRDQLRVRVLERRARRRAVVLEHQDVAQPEIALQIEHRARGTPTARARSRPPTCGASGSIVIRRLDDHLVRADAVHPVEHPVALAIERRPRPAAPETCWGRRAGPSPGAFGAPPSGRYASTSGGVIASCPGQNGQCSRPIDGGALEPEVVRDASDDRWR